MPTGFWPWFVVGGEVALKVGMIVVVLLRRRARPAPTLAWIVLILAVPVVGVVAYVMVGEIRLGRRLVVRHREITERIQQLRALHKSGLAIAHAQIHERFQHIATLAESVRDNIPRPGNALSLLGATDLFVQSLVEDIDGAKDHCHLLFYIYSADHSGRMVGEALMRAASPVESGGRGVTCRVLVDAVGSKHFTGSSLRREMEANGVQVVEAMPVRPFRMLLSRIDLRNHRKIVVIDGRVGYTGSQNLADAEFAIKKKFGPWVDAMVRVEGPAVHDLQMLFVEDWFLDTDESLEGLLDLTPEPLPDGAGGIPVQVVGTGPNAYNEAMRQLVQTALHTAREELIITTPYFVPDDTTVTALCSAARRGLTTALVVPARNDSPFVAAASRSHYETLLDHGVTIHEYQKGLLHTKTLTIDRDLSLVSTANLDRRSFELNFEVSMVVYDRNFTSRLRFLQRSYMADSKEVDAGEWRKRGWPQRLWQNAAGMLSPIL